MRKINIHKNISQEMVKLASSSFGLVAALAWNELIKEIVNQYIKPLVGGASGTISLLIYAIVVTIFAVIITSSLTKLIKK